MPEIKIVSYVSPPPIPQPAAKPGMRYLPPESAGIQSAQSGSKTTAPQTVRSVSAVWNQESSGFRGMYQLSGTIRNQMESS